MLTEAACPVAQLGTDTDRNLVSKRLGLGVDCHPIVVLSCLVMVMGFQLASCEPARLRGASFVFSGTGANWLWACAVNMGRASARTKVRNFIMHILSFTAAPACTLATIILVHLENAI